MKNRTRTCCLISASLITSNVSGQSISTELDVPGTANLWLSGMRSGAKASACDDGVWDRSPAESPAQVVGIPLKPGAKLTFAGSGKVANGPFTLSVAQPPDGLEGYVTSNLRGAENGIANVTAPLDSLLGVFVGADDPDVTPAPESLDFSTQLSRDYRTLAPALKQTFFIGDGTDSTGARQFIQIPRGAKRLYLGTVDGCGHSNNEGVFHVQVKLETPPGLQIEVSEVSLNWFAKSNVVYQLQYRQDAAAGTWQPLGPQVQGDGTFHSVQERLDDTPMRVYRVVEIP